MDMKRLEISKLMDEYTDTEFYPTGGSVANAEAVKEQVLAQAVPAKRRRMPLRNRVLLAAALAAMLAILVGAGVPSKLIQTLNSSIFHQESPGHDHITRLVPVSLENGRLWFIADGQHIDITDLIDEETPYIYDGSDPETGLVNYLIVGGTPENYGWHEHLSSPDVPYYGGGGENTLDTYYYCAEDGVTYREDQLTPEQRRQVDMKAEGWEIRLKDRPWMVTAALELGIPFTFETTELLYGPFPSAQP